MRKLVALNSFIVVVYMLLFIFRTHLSMGVRYDVADKGIALLGVQLLICIFSIVRDKVNFLWYVLIFVSTSFVIWMTLERFNPY